MARIYDGDIKRGDLAKAAPSSLVIVPADNSRYGWQGKTLEDILADPMPSIEEKVASMVREGQIQPISCHPIAGNKLKVHAGFTRAVAGMLIVSRGLVPEFRLDCKVEDCNEKEAFRRSVVENHERSATTVVDDANAVRRLTAFGYSDTEICTMFGWGPRWLPEVRRILQLPDEIKEAIHTRQLSATAGIRLSKIEDAETRDKVLEEAKKDAGKSPVNDKHIRKAIDRDPEDEFLDKPVPLRITEVRDFWRERSLPGSNTPRVRRVADFVLRYMAGEIDAKAIDAELARI